MNGSSKKWRIDFQGAGAEEAAFDLSSSEPLAISGAQVINEEAACLFLSSTEGELQAVLAVLKQRGFSIITVESQDNRDWVKAVQDSWTPFKVGSFTINPIVKESPPPPAANDKEILIRPGFGFGTGLSKTTQTALYSLEHFAALPMKPTKILDVGTGSGILSIAAAKLFPSASIHAIDIDEAVVENAAGNVELNGLTGRISTQWSNISAFDYSADLIMANVEIGIHLELCRDFNRLSAPHARLLVSGLRDSVTAAQYQRLLESNGATQREPAGKWELAHAVEEMEWKAFVFTKVG